MKATVKQNAEKAAKFAMSQTERELERAGLSLSVGMKKLKALLDAQKTVAGSVDFVEVPDNPTQLKALDMLFTLGDHYPAKKMEHGGEVKIHHDVSLTNLERATRLAYLLTKAKEKRDGKKGN